MLEINYEFEYDDIDGCHQAICIRLFAMVHKLLLLQKILRERYFYSYRVDDEEIV